MVGLLVVGLLVVSLMAAGNAHAMQTGEEVSAPGGSESSEVTIFQLEHIDAQEALKILLPLMEGSSSRATLVPQSNRIALVGSHSELVTFTELLRKLDSDQRKPVDPLVGKPASGDVVILQAASDVSSIDRLQNECRDLEQQCLDSAQAIRSDKRSDRSSKSPAVQKLVSLVQRSFDARQQLQRAQLAASARRLEKIQKTIEMRDVAKDQIVQRRIEQLLNAQSGSIADRSDESAKKDSSPANTSPLADATNVETPEIQIHEIREIDPKLAWRILSQRFVGVFMDLVQTNKLVVHAPRRVHQEINQVLLGLAGEGTEFQVIDLKGIDVESTLAMLHKFFGETGRIGSEPPIIDGDILKQRLYIKASPEQTQKIRLMIEKLESGTAAGEKPNKNATPRSEANVQNSSAGTQSGSAVNLLSASSPTSSAVVGESDLLRTTPAAMRKDLRAKAIALLGAIQSLEETKSDLAAHEQGPRRSETLKDEALKQEALRQENLVQESLKTGITRFQEAVRYNEDELRFALLQYEQILAYLRFVETDIARRIAAAQEDYNYKTQLFQRGSCSRVEVNEARERTLALDVEQKRVEGLLKLYVAAGDVAELNEVRQKMQAESKQQDEKPPKKDTTE